MNKENYLKTPVYRESASYARENEQQQLYFASHRANVACKEAIEKAIRDNYDGQYLDPEGQGLAQVVAEFGAERMFYVLAATILRKSWDERFSPANREWANTVGVCENLAPDGWNRNADFVVDSHSGLTDLFVTLARKNY